MKARYLFLTVFMILVINLHPQEYITKSGRIDIVSKTALYRIEGVNKKVASILNIKTGEFIISLLIRSFEFKETVAEEQFNLKYLESESFPKSVFRGKILNLSDVDFATDGIYKVIVKGDLTIHGVTNQVEVNGLIGIANGIISAKSEFYVSLADYNIKAEHPFNSSIRDRVLLKINLFLTRHIMK